MLDKLECDKIYDSILGDRNNWIKRKVKINYIKNYQ